MNILARAIIFTNFAGKIFNFVGDRYRMSDLSICERKRKSFLFVICHFGKYSERWGNGSGVKWAVETQELVFK